MWRLSGSSFEACRSPRIGRDISSGRVFRNAHQVRSCAASNRSITLKQIYDVCKGERSLKETNPLVCYKQRIDPAITRRHFDFVPPSVGGVLPASASLFAGALGFPSAFPCWSDAVSSFPVLDGSTLAKSSSSLRSSPDNFVSSAVAVRSPLKSKTCRRHQS